MGDGNRGLVSQTAMNPDLLRTFWTNQKAELTNLSWGIYQVRYTLKEPEVGINSSGLEGIELGDGKREFVVQHPETPTRRQG